MTEQKTPKAWNILENRLEKARIPQSERIFSLSNSRMQQGGHFEESYSGDPQSIPPAINWIGINIKIDGEVLDLNHCEILHYERILNMQEGYLERSFEVVLVSGKKVKVKSQRFCSLDQENIGAVRYSLRALNFSGLITVEPSLRLSDWAAKSQWTEQQQVKQQSAAMLLQKTGTDRQFCAAMRYVLQCNDEVVDEGVQLIKKEKYLACSTDFEVKDGDKVDIYKYLSFLSDQDYPGQDLVAQSESLLENTEETGFDQLLENQRLAWQKKWANSDIQIEGDLDAQQNIRYHLFQLHQNYPATETGEGAVYWDREIYALPFYLATAHPDFARNLLILRHQALPSAIAYAASLGYSDGAALYPMITRNPAPQQSLEGIHQNGAIAFAIYDYLRHTDDPNFLSDYGLEILLALARFWAQRVHFSEQRRKYVLHGVTGPNEYESNSTNNWYTSLMAKWTLEYTIEAIELVKTETPERYKELEEQIKFYEYTERNQWKKIIADFYLPEDVDQGIFLQQDNYLDKAQVSAKDLKETEKPLYQHWSKDRILRSALIQQPDVLQGIYLLEAQFDGATIQQNFEFYEPRMVYETSVAACIPAILAARIKQIDKAFSLYQKLPGISSEPVAIEGVSVSGAVWMTIVKGFGGMRVTVDGLVLNPMLPATWDAYAFQMQHKGQCLKVRVMKEQVEIINQSNQSLKVEVNGQMEEIVANDGLIIRTI